MRRDYQVFALVIKHLICILKARCQTNWINFRWKFSMQFFFWYLISFRAQNRFRYHEDECQTNTKHVYLCNSAINTNTNTVIDCQHQCKHTFQYWHIEFTSAIGSLLKNMISLFRVWLLFFFGYFLFVSVNWSIVN